MRGLSDREAMEMMHFYVSDEVGIWLTCACHDDMTIAEFEEAFREEYGIPETALPDAKAKLWAMKPKKGGVRAYMWDILKGARALFGLKTGQNFSKEQETELIHIITKGLPAGICQFIHKEGQSTLDQLMK